MIDPYRKYCQEAYVIYSRSKLKTKILKQQKYTCPVCFTIFQYSQLEYHSNSLKHRNCLKKLRKGINL